MEVLFINLSLNLRSPGLSLLGSDPGPELPSSLTSHWSWPHSAFPTPFAQLADLRSTALLL